MSHTALTYHIVIGTYKRQRVIIEQYETRLYRFIYDYLKKREVRVRRIGGMPDHVHILCDIPAKYSLADIVRGLKTESSKYMGYSQCFPNWIKWAKGYGGFTVDASLREVRRQYIMRQKEHHKGITFEREYRELLIEYEYDGEEGILGDEDE